MIVPTFPTTDSDTAVLSPSVVTAPSQSGVTPPQPGVSPPASHSLPSMRCAAAGSGGGSRSGSTGVPLRGGARPSRPRPLSTLRAEGFPSPSSEAVGVKQCPRCGEMRTAEQYARDGSKASGYKSHCKDCDNQRSRRYYAANRERVIDRVLSRHAELRKS